MIYVYFLFFTSIISFAQTFKITDVLKKDNPAYDETTISPVNALINDSIQIIDVTTSNETGAVTPAIDIEIDTDIAKTKINKTTTTTSTPRKNAVSQFPIKQLVTPITTKEERPVSLYEKLSAVVGLVMGQKISVPGMGHSVPISLFR
ncbi:uncharacterized protein LOC127287023 [Leptopilina boulardi]|uniref:uncharacterized protein LOC127287023 n=1 Tax=Leptopilina boulardi TaxID=63433 RepID=UPI0021F62BEE|nr:uncharacterized protein LOC127287023 [Leptopilina boulardi]